MNISSLLFSALASSCVELEDEISLNRSLKNKTFIDKIFGFFRTVSSHIQCDVIESEMHCLDLVLPLITGTCAMSAIKFIMYATLARYLSRFCDKDWGSGSASLVAQGIGFVERIPVFNANMDLIFECIFDPC
ncbi:MAG: hypothetical protein LBH59_02840 [Planctomycetaceae bacterium]|nr:hypothetical protein [Planctomycetaceae bacterium]